MAQDINRDKTEVGAARWTAPASVLHFTGQNVMLRWARFSPQRHRQRRSRMDSARNFSYDIRKIWQHYLVFHNSLCCNIWRVSVGFMICDRMPSTWTISTAKMREAAFPLVLNASAAWSRKRSASAPNKASLPQAENRHRQIRPVYPGHEDYMGWLAQAENGITKNNAEPEEMLWNESIDGKTYISINRCITKSIRISLPRRLWKQTMVWEKQTRQRKR